MTVKCGQKCTAIRRIIVPEKYIEDAQIQIGKSLSKTTIGDPRVEGVRMGSLAGAKQVNEVRERIELLLETSELVYGDLDQITLVEGTNKNGSYMSPILMRADNPFENQNVHEVEAFGPASTLMPYKSMDEAIELAKMGKGSLVCSVATYDNQLALTYTYT